MLRSACYLLLVSLSACGQSGALYLPDQEPKAQAAPSVSKPSHAADDDTNQKKPVPAQP